MIYALQDCQEACQLLCAVPGRPSELWSSRFMLIIVVLLSSHASLNFEQPPGKCPEID